ncbi:ATP-grasp domain-containing protein [Sporosarcina sp. ANT_H38]|uniref:ATP-grasp domain-containing protein n=1 Tax=Sporosarcina sp. ANT_H38 TaxID=2597358 RepID=UPI0011F239F2|nr:ATP-grasp domain-containing protein [Sporosarcina sp. ANT_H38]KAA0944213.1 ATP-grasp domain-containing protein [Sporosarcina sp. ANT_H38]
MNILLTSAGRRGYLVNYFKEALKKQGEIHVANSTEHSTAMIHGDHSIVTPLISDDAYIPFLKKYCEEHNIDAIIPLFDIDLHILSKNKKEFEEIGTQIIVSNNEVIRICNDKWMTYNYLKRNGFNTPLTFLSSLDAVNAVQKNQISFPLIVKPRWGMGSISIFEADNIEELAVFYKKVGHSIQTTYLAFESQQDIENCIIIQEKIVGQEYGLDIINDLKGNYQTTIIKKKYAMRSGETDCSETVSNSGLEKVGEKLSGVMGHISNLDVDIFVMQGVPYVLEMNARFGGGYPFSHIAGVDLPKAIVRWLKGEVVGKSLFEAEIGVVGYKDLSVIGNRKRVAPSI